MAPPISPVGDHFVLSYSGGPLRGGKTFKRPLALVLAHLVRPPAKTLAFEALWKEESRKLRSGVSTTRDAL